MIHIFAVALFIFALSIVMIMSGRGGGNFYVILLVLSGVPIRIASTTSQFILLASATMGAAGFGRSNLISWPLLLFFGGLNSLMAFVGGFESHLFSGTALKIILALVLSFAGIIMLLPGEHRAKSLDPRPGHWIVSDGQRKYCVNLWLATPVVLATGFLSGMVGISGGSVLIPLMVVGCGIPVHMAAGTASAILVATAFTGFAGNAFHGGFDPGLAIPCGTAAVAGGWLGSKVALQTSSKKLKAISGALTIAAGVVMLVNTYLSDS